MIKIRCAELETARVNPIAYGASMAIVNAAGESRRYGMLACFRDVAALTHKETMTRKESVKELKSRFGQYAETRANKKRQEELIARFAKYMDDYDARKFEYVEGRRLMKWPIHEKVKLSGLTPWVVSSGNEYSGYFVVEDEIKWKDELRFPLTQKYLADKIVECDLNQLSVGVYCLSTGQFELKTFSVQEVNASVAETKKLFANVYNEYNNRK